MNTDHPLVAIVTRPWFWWALLALWIVWWYRKRKWPDIAPKYLGPNRHKPGTLVRGGSSATSGTEKRVLASLNAAGYRTLPSELYLIVPLADRHGKWRKFTPDILLADPKVVVEVDPYRWHGEDGPHKIYDDVERNVGYSACGWAIVRVRIGWPADHPWRTIGKYDVVIEADDFYPAEHAELIRRAIAKAKPVKARSWDRQLAALRPYYDQHQQMQAAKRQQQDGWGT